MDLIGKLLSLVFGNSRNAVVEVAEVFRENAEAGAVRAATIQTAALSQFASEFQHPKRGGFDRMMDGVNRIPRPAMALGTLLLFCTAMFDPVWFQDRMAGLAAVPQPLWWLLGVVVSFYFGARHQVKTQDFQREIAKSLTGHQAPVPQTKPTDPVVKHTENAAVTDWRRWRGNHR